MSSEILVWIVAIMIFYDLFMHITAFSLGLEKARKLWWFPQFKIKGKYNVTFYQRFWISYWGLALFLVVYYLLTL